MKDYFFKPPINQFSLNFLDQELERSYRTSYQEEVRFPSYFYERNLLFVLDSLLSALCFGRLFFFFFFALSDRTPKTTPDFSQSISPKLRLHVNLSTQGKQPRSFCAPSFSIAGMSFLGPLLIAGWHLPHSLLPSLGLPNTTCMSLCYVYHSTLTFQILSVPTIRL